MPLRFIAFGSLVEVIEPRTDAPEGPQSDLDIRLEKIIGPAKVQALRKALDKMPDPAKQRRASSILSKLADGEISQDQAADELDLLGRAVWESDGIDNCSLIRGHRQRIPRPLYLSRQIRRSQYLLLTHVGL